MMTPTPDIDIPELRRLEKAATAPREPGTDFNVTLIADAEADYFSALRNAAPALLAKWEECERLRAENVELRDAIAAHLQTIAALEEVGRDCDGFGGCESCGTPFVSDDDGVSCGDVYFCQKCYAEWKAEYDACEHDWEPTISIGELRVCRKCNGYEPDAALSTYEGKSE